MLGKFINYFYRLPFFFIILHVIWKNGFFMDNMSYDLIYRRSKRMFFKRCDGMRRRILHILFSLMTLALFTGCDVLNDLNSSHLSVEENVTEGQTILLEDLKHTENFRKGALEHILEGELNAQGQAVGFHYDGLPSKKGEIIEGTETTPDQYGVYEAEIMVEGKKKPANSGKSTFFPDEWHAQQVVDAINEAYEARSFLTGNTYEGLAVSGIHIRMYLDDDEKIISAFPIYRN